MEMVLINLLKAHGFTTFTFTSTDGLFTIAAKASKNNTSYLVGITHFLEEELSNTYSLTCNIGDINILSSADLSFSTMIDNIMEIFRQIAEGVTVKEEDK